MLLRSLTALLLLALFALPLLSVTATHAQAQDRSLKLYFGHTGEKAEITFKRNGRFDPKGLAQLNQFLRDWRQNQPTKMDPRLFDLVWEVYRRSGATGYINVVSAFRSPPTNNMLRTRSRTTGVAKNSQHMLGKAMDFFIPGVKLATLRAIAMQMQVGGVGFYPTSGSPFVHLDVGSVRAWPRMSRQELVQIFPNGRTLHLPAQGEPLPGYEEAMADYKKRVGADSIQVASSAGGPLREQPEKKKSLLAMLFGGGGADEEEDNAEMQAPAVASRPATRNAPAASDEDGEAPVAVASAAPTPAMARQQEAAPEIAAPVPLSRPAFRNDGQGPGGLATALYSQPRNLAQEALAMQASAPIPPSPATEGFADLSGYSIPVPTLLGPRGLKGDADPGVMTAYAGSMPSDLGSVPLPGHRPATGPASVPVPAQIARAEAPKDEGQNLTPELVAALSRSVEAPQPLAAPPRPTVAAASVVPASATAPGTSVSQAQPSAPRPAQRPMDVAALPRKPAGNGMQFGDGFDAPRPQAGNPVPGKGGRSGHNGAAEQARTAPLTGDMVAKWALDNNHAPGAAAIKAPRVVNRTLNSEYSAAYSNGFKPVSQTVAIDANRFGGPDP